MSDHLSRERLESLLAGVLPVAIRTPAEEHLRACASCDTRRQAMTTAREQYQAAHPVAEFARAVMARAAVAKEPAVSESVFSKVWARWGRGLRFALPAAVAMALIVVVAPRREVIRFKGEAPLVWQVFAKRGERSWRVGDGETLVAGDQLAFTYSIHANRYLSVFGIDDAGQVVAYGPPAPVLLRPNQDQVPFGVELDERRGEERLFAFFSAQPLEPATTRDWLHAGFARARAEQRGLQQITIDVPAGVQTRTLWFKKR